MTKERPTFAEMKMPVYTAGEERMNTITHAVGVGIGVAVTLFGILTASAGGKTGGVLSAAVFGITMICLYAVSSVYHGLPAGIGKKVMRIIDHCTIYLLIAGTYTPITLVALMSTDYVMAWTVFGIEWVCAAAAIALTAADMQRFSKLSMVFYIVMGWMIIISAKSVITAIGADGFVWLLAGGIAYTVGAVLYGVGKKKKYFHSIFHIFVLLGSVLQAVCVLFYVI